MECIAERANLESATLDIWPGLDGALHNDGCRCVARLAAWRLGGQRRPLLLFLLQLALNATWTPLFFGLHRPDLAFAEIVLLWSSIAVTLAMFCSFSRTAAWLLVPYLAWVSFAAVLNLTLWRFSSL